jgi:hypothetical protein
MPGLPRPQPLPRSSGSDEDLLQSIRGGSAPPSANPENDLVAAAMKNAIERVAAAQRAMRAERGEGPAEDSAAAATADAAAARHRARIVRSGAGVSPIASSASEEARLEAAAEARVRQRIAELSTPPTAATAFSSAPPLTAAAALRSPAPSASAQKDGALALRLAAADAAWSAFERGPPDGRLIGMEDIPWPDFGLLRLAAASGAGGVGGVDLRLLVARWAPEAFRARFASRIGASERGRVMRRVAEVAALLNAERLRAAAAQESSDLSGESDYDSPARSTRVHRFTRGDDSVY